MLQSVRVIFDDVKVNYSTSISATSTKKDIESYFIGIHVEGQRANNVIFLSQNVKCTTEQNARFKIGLIYYPDSNLREWAIIDPGLCAAVGFSKGKIYHPAGGRKAVNDIVKGEGLVIGSVNQMQKLVHCHDDVYRVYFE